MHKLNAKEKENIRLLEVAGGIVGPILDAGKPVESGSLLSGSDSNVGLAMAPATPALALAQ